MILHRARLALGVSVVLAIASQAQAATFVITIKNTSTAYMAPGVVTLSPLISVGPAPNPGTQQYATYVYAKFDCSIADSYCPSGSNFTCWFGNSDTLLKRWNLTDGVNAWVPQPPSSLAGYTVFAPGDSATVLVTASPGQKLSYVTKAGDFSRYVDQAVMMHAPGDPGDLTVPLFDAAGLPLSNINFELGGYTVSSSSPVDGTQPECANQCPAAGGHTTGCFVALGSTATGSLLPVQPTPTQLSLAWSYSAAPGYTTDGLALGDLTSSTGNELVVSMEGGAAPGNTLGVGRAVVLAGYSGTALSQFDGPVAGHDFLGVPMIENLSPLASSYGHYLVSEFAQATPLPGSVVYARNGASTPLWTSTGYGFAGLWNMGPSAGDVRSDVTGNGNPNEVVIADYNGDILVVKSDTATTMNSYNLYSSNADNIYGHAAIADVHTAAGNEIVVTGAKSGKVYVFGTQPGNNTPLSLLYASAKPLNGGYPFGSGPAIADLDGDGKAEIVIATAGVAGVYAYSTAKTACKYKWSSPGGFDYSWSSPVIGDVDGDGKPEIIVMSSDSVLSVLKVPSAGTSCVEGTVLWKYTVGNGGPAWFTPALANVTGSSALDIIVANYQTLEVLDVSKRGSVMRFNDASAQFYPSAIVERGSSSGPGAAIYLSGWANGKVYKLTTSTGAPVPTLDWPTFMGGNTRTGAR